MERWARRMGDMKLRERASLGKEVVCVTGQARGRARWVWEILEEEPEGGSARGLKAQS